MSRWTVLELLFLFSGSFPCFLLLFQVRSKSDVSTQRVITLTKEGMYGDEVLRTCSWNLEQTKSKDLLGNTS